MDPTEAQDMLAANPISLGLTNDFGMTTTQAGFEGMSIGDELVLENVMSRVDWIIQLRDIFYELLKSAKNQN